MASNKKSKEECWKNKKPTNDRPQENGHSNGRKKNKEEMVIEEEEVVVIEEEEENDAISVQYSSASESEEGTIEITGDDDEDEEEEEEIEEIEEEAKGKGKRKGKSRDSEDEEEERGGGGGGGDGTTCRFPMARIKRIMKAENPSLQAGGDVVFLLNKATEMFLDQFCEEAYGAMVRDRKKALAYKHLAFVVKEEERYDFLRDYVPEKVTAKDALKERNSP